MKGLKINFKDSCMHFKLVGGYDFYLIYRKACFGFCDLLETTNLKKPWCKFMFGFCQRNAGAINNYSPGSQTSLAVHSIQRVLPWPSVKKETTQSPAGFLIIQFDMIYSTEFPEIHPLWHQPHPWPSSSRVKAGIIATVTESLGPALV